VDLWVEIVNCFAADALRTHYGPLRTDFEPGRVSAWGMNISFSFLFIFLLALYSIVGVSDGAVTRNVQS
jgi:hypothetical protein